MNDEELAFARIAPIANPGDGHGRSADLNDASVGRPSEAALAIAGLAELTGDAIGQTIAESCKLSRGSTQRARGAEERMAVRFLSHVISLPRPRHTLAAALPSRAQPLDVLSGGPLLPIDHVEFHQLAFVE